MAFVTVFKRYELKYMLTLEQKEIILKAMSPYMELDKNEWLDDIRSEGHRNAPKGQKNYSDF